MADVVIRVRNNGPLLVEGPVTIRDAQGNRLRHQPRQAGRRFVPVWPVGYQTVLRRLAQPLRLSGRGTGAGRLNRWRRSPTRPAADFVKQAAGK